MAFRLKQESFVWFLLQIFLLSLERNVEAGKHEIAEYQQVVSIGQTSRCYSFHSQT